MPTSENPPATTINVPKSGLLPFPSFDPHGDHATFALNSENANKDSRILSNTIVLKCKRSKIRTDRKKGTVNKRSNRR